MGYLSKLQNFFESIQNNSEKSLSCDKLVDDFIKYMVQNFKYDEYCFQKEFEENSEGYNNFNEYIYKVKMNLNKDLREEYVKVEAEAEKCVNICKERVKYFSEKVESIKNGKKRERKKYKFFLNISKELLEAAEKNREKTEIFYRALGKASATSQNMFYDDYYMRIFECEKIDWKLIINFLDANDEELGKLKKMKEFSCEEYLKLFKEYINNHNILERILCITSNNYYLKNRKEIISEAINLFRREKYVTFVYLIVPQIEGLIDIYKTVLGINYNDTCNGLMKKLDIINKHKSFLGYIYYEFEFPELRNNIAHGEIIEITTQMAYDTLMDVFYLFHEIESKDREYKIILKFFENFPCKQLDRDSSYVLEYFTNNIKSNENLAWLKKCLEGKYDDMLSAYKYTDNFNKLKEFFNSHKLQTSIYNYESIEEEIKTCEVEGMKFEYKHINKDLLKYMPLLNILKEYVNFPEKWLNDVYQIINDINEISKERKELIKNNLKLKVVN